MSGGGTKVIFIKKKSKHAAHHGGAWKVAYADFVTAMMALFIVLWLLTQSDEASKERIAQYFRTGMLPGGTLTLGTPAGSNPPVAINIFPSGSMGGPMPDRRLADDIEVILNGMESDPDLAPLSKHITLKVVDEGTLIELIDGGDNFLFPVAGSGLKPGAVDFLKRLAPLLAKLRNKVEIHGHTDARQFDGGKKSNWDLSFDRANEARRVLESNGVPSGKISGVLAHADSSPFNKKDPYAPENRRLSILVLREKPTRKGVRPPPPLPTAPPAAPAPAASPTPTQAPAKPQAATGEPPAPTPAPEPHKEH